MERLLHPIPEAAEILGVGRTSVYRLIDVGELETVTVGKRRLIPHAALEEFVQRARRNGGIR